MSPATSNWLSFSRSPVDMLRSSESQFVSFEGSSSASPRYLIDNFYANEEQAVTTMAETFILASSADPENQHQQAPKLEDFLGEYSSSIVRYSDNSQTETQDSSLTDHIYDHGPAAYDLKAITEFQTFSTNSGSEVDDSNSIPRTQLSGSEFVSHSIESTRNELGFSNCGGTNNGLSLGVNNNRAGSTSKEKAIVSVDSDRSNRKLADTFGLRTSIYRGVTRHRWTGRYEAHLWDNSCRREGQARKGSQVYLGGYDKEEKAARAYDLAAIKYWGLTATTNFPVSNYTKELEEMKYVSKQEFIASLKRKSSGFSRGASIYRGVTRHHQRGRWQARIGRVAGNKDLYLGTFATEEEAAEAYDIAAIKFRGTKAVTNFEMNRYDMEAIMKSALPIGSAAKRLRLSLEAEQKPTVNNEQHRAQSCSNRNNSINFGAIHQHPVSATPCGFPFENSASLYHLNLFQPFQAARTFAATDRTASDSSMAATPMAIVPQAAEIYRWPH